MFPGRETITAVILAGGAGSRVGGRDKGLVAWHARPLIGHALEAVAPHAGRLIISANRNHDVYQRYGHPVLSDAVPGFAGPLAGIATALAAAATPWLLTVPVDGPMLPESYGRRMLEAATAQRAAVVVAHDGQRRQPLFALYASALASAAADALASTDGAVWRFQEAHAPIEVRFERMRFADLDEFDVPGYADNF